MIRRNRYGKLKFGEKVKCHTVCYERAKFPHSLTDDSYFVPSSEANKNIDKTKTMSHDPSLYDMPEGSSEANFEKLARIRKPGRDITMIQKEAEELSNIAMGSINKDAENKIIESVKTSEKKRNEMTHIASTVANNTINNTSK